MEDKMEERNKDHGDCEEISENANEEKEWRGINTAEI